MQLSESIALKNAGSKPASALAAKVQKIRNTNQKGLTPGKAPGSAAVDKTSSQF